MTGPTFPPPSAPSLPTAPIQRIVKPIERFLHIEAAGGAVLLACTIVALALANSPAAEAFEAIWKTPVSFAFGDFKLEYHLRHWINDGLMGIFFFVVGLEVKRELVLGELRDPRRAALPIAAAIGGMVVPAGTYLLLQGSGPARSGWGVPMATDIAFVVGLMAVLGKRVPNSLRALLLSLAIADDIGAIVVIAVGYTETINVGALVLGIVGLAVVIVLSQLGVRAIPVYVAIGSFVWLQFHESGIHPTIAGVLLGLLTPTTRWVSLSRAGKTIEKATKIIQGEGLDSGRARAAVRTVAVAVRETLSPVERLENALHPWSSFLIMPIFALANAGVAFHFDALGEPVAIAIAAALLFGKPIGIVLVSWLAVKAGLASLPDGITWSVLTAGGFLAGIGFTMALFIAGLALEGDVLETAKVGILAGSLLAGVIGFVMLRTLLPEPVEA